MSLGPPLAALAAALRQNDDNLPRIPGGVATVAVLTTGLGLWLIFGQGGSNPNAAPLRFIGLVVILCSLLVLAEAFDYVRFASTPW